MDELEETVQAQGGVLLAHTALFAAVLSVLRDKGALIQDEVNAAIDAALVGVENAPTITPATMKQGRVYLEQMAQEMAGVRKTAG